MLQIVALIAVGVGFVWGVNPAMTIGAAILLSALGGGYAPDEVLRLFGKAFAAHRYLLLYVLALPTIGVVERRGLAEVVARLFVRSPRVTPRRILLGYLMARHLSSLSGLNALGGHAQTVRPLLVPLVERSWRQSCAAAMQEIRAMCAATDNVASFFGQNLFAAYPAVLLMKGVLDANGLQAPLETLAHWGIPTAIAALSFQTARIVLWERRLRRSAQNAAPVTDIERT